MMIRDGIAIVAFTCATFVPSLVTNASELNDAMQSYFAGQHEAAAAQLTRVIDRGEVDARLYYFRGLAELSLGQNDAAELDFQKGAALEIQGQGPGVGTSLQRIQGASRLTLERHRRLAMLRARHRQQSPAPKPIANGAPQGAGVSLASHQQRLSGTSKITLRMASEIPLASERLPDPFADDSAVVVNPPDVERPLPGLMDSTPDQPVGSGVVNTERDGAERVSAEADDIFGDDGATTDAAEGNSSISKLQAGESRGVFGSIFRAFGRATVPKVNPAAMIPGGMPIGNAGPPKTMPEFSGPANAGFDEPQFVPLEVPTAAPEAPE